MKMPKMSKLTKMPKIKDFGHFIKEIIFRVTLSHFLIPYGPEAAFFI